MENETTEVVEMAVETVEAEAAELKSAAEAADSAEPDNRQRTKKQGRQRKRPAAEPWQPVPPIVTTVEEFVKALRVGKPERKTSIPALTCAKVSAGKIVTTDLDLWTVTEWAGQGGRSTSGSTDSAASSAASSAAETVCLLPYFHTLDLLEGEKGRLVIEPLKNNWVRLEVAGCEFKLAGMNVANFPQEPAEIEPTAEIQAVDLLQMINRIIFSISKEQSRYILNGALLEINAESGLARMVATDGYRLALAEAAAQGRLEAGRQSEVAKDTNSLIVPLDALNWLRSRIDKKSDEVVRIGNDHSQGTKSLVRFTIGPDTLYARKRELTRQFPNWRAVMPRKDAVRTWVKFKSAKALAATLARVAKCADERSGCVTWEFAAAGSGLSAKSCEAGEASARLDCAIEGEAVKIGWNAGYVLEFLRVVGEGPVRMGIRDEKSAAVFEAEEGAGAGAGVGGWSYMLMPMRVLTAEAEREKG